MSKVKKSGKLVYGFGVNDSDQATIRNVQVGGVSKVVWRCPYYATWCSMLSRCYSEKHLKRNPTYEGCSVCDEWKSFMAFKKWMEKQDWEGNQLDKDFLFKGNKTYSPETCIFMHRRVNTFISDSAATRGEYMVGAYRHTVSGRFVARCRNPFQNKTEHLGCFSTELEAHLAWKKRKHELACQLADSEYVTDERVRVALRNWYK